MFHKNVYFLSCFGGWVDFNVTRFQSSSLSLEIDIDKSRSRNFTMCQPQGRPNVEQPAYSMSRSSWRFLRPTLYCWHRQKPTVRSEGYIGPLRFRKEVDCQIGPSNDLIQTMACPLNWYGPATPNRKCRSQNASNSKKLIINTKIHQCATIKPPFCIILRADSEKRTLSIDLYPK